MHGRLSMWRVGFIAAVVFMSGCAQLPTDYERVESSMLTDTEATQLGQAAPMLASGESGMRPLPNGVDALVTRIVLAEAAERSLDVQYYIWHDDLTGRLFAHALLRAADRGVRVRILLDDVGARANDDNLLSLDLHPNIEIRLFNPVASRSLRGLGMLSDLERLNRRMHNKAYIADNQRAVVGGRNIGDEYFEAAGDVAFGDLDLVTVGPVVVEISKAFDSYWNAPMSLPIGVLTGRQGTVLKLDTLRADLAEFAEAQRGSPYGRGARTALVKGLATASEGFFRGKAHVLVDDPEKVSRTKEDKQGHLLPQFSTLNLQMRTELLIISPYFIPGDVGVAWLSGLVRSGLRVVVLTNSLASSDVSAVHAGYKRYREALLEAGVELYEFKPEAIEFARSRRSNSQIGSSRASLHAKTFVFDRRAVFVGSLNLDPRSIQLNTEIGVVCESEPLASRLANNVTGALDKVAWRLERVLEPDGSARIVWIETTDKGTLRLPDEPGVSVWRQIGVWFMGLLPIESQL